MVSLFSELETILLLTSYKTNPTQMSTFRRFLKSVWIALLITIPQAAYSQQDSTTVHSRPKIGLVLSGGGAKGAAHIGVLKYIEEAGIPIDYIAGTSMGSIVGGMYALGYSSDEILSIISSVDWDRLISNKVDREKISYESKLKSSTQTLTLPFSFNNDAEKIKAKSFKNSLPTGIVSGSNLINLFNSLSVGYSDPIDFNELPIPFICVATNMINGEAEVFNKGVFTKALRASMAIPILFDPIKIDSTLYVDGGLVNNFPAEQCRAMGADFVIGVSMSPGLESETDNLSSIFSQVKQLKEIITDKEFENYHKLCDIFISPDLKGVGMLSFDTESVARITQSGYEAAVAQEDNFKALKEVIFADNKNKASKDVDKNRAINIVQNSVLISKIEMVGIKSDIEKWARRKCTVKTGEQASKSDIDKSVSIYYGTGNYDSITYSLHKDDNSESGYILRFNFVENPPHAFGAGFRFDSQDMISVLLRLGLNSNRINGFKADVSAKLGSNQWLKTNFSYGKLLYPKVNLEYIFRNSELDAYDMDELVMNMKFLQHKFRLYLSENYSRTVSLGAGIEAEILQPRKVMYSLYDAVDSDYKLVNTLGAFAYLRYDNLNKSSFATRGVKGDIDFLWKDITFTSKGTNTLGAGSLTFGIEGYVPIIENRLVVIPQLYGGFLFGKGATNGSSEGWNPLFNGPVPCYPSMNNMLGGTEMGRYIDQHLPFIGLNKISLTFNNLAIGRIDVRTRLFKKHYLTVMFNYGRSGIDFKNFIGINSTPLWSEMYTYNASNWWGAGLRYSIDTKIGPVSFDISSSNISRKPNFYFSLGHFF